MSRAELDFLRQAQEMCSTVICALTKTDLYPAWRRVRDLTTGHLAAADIEVPDLRGGFSHLIAALTAEGQSKVTNLGIISRGYENFIEKLRLLGADFIFES